MLMEALRLPAQKGAARAKGQVDRIRLKPLKIGAIVGQRAPSSASTQFLLSGEGNLRAELLLLSLLSSQAL